jgi:hypothetical protein
VAATLLASGGMLAALAAAGPAQAAGRVPFTISEQIDFGAGLFTFTATGPFCASGTFQDDVKVAAFAHSEQARRDGLNLLIRTTYTCDDGSGTFNAQKHVFITFVEGGFPNVGPTQIMGGTGAYAGIAGHGVDNGASDDATGTGGGSITGFVREHP